MANGVGDIYADGYHITSWSSPCMLKEIQVPATTKVMAVYVNTVGDSAAFAVKAINARLLPSTDWRCVMEEAVADWMNPTFEDTGWPFANRRIRQTCSSISEQLVNIPLNWTHLTYINPGSAVKLFCRCSLPFQLDDNKDVFITPSIR